MLKIVGSKYIKGIDGLRAISVLFVIIGHCGFHRFPASLGVTIFFFISGFLITTILIADADDSNRKVNISSFYVRRFIRLLPEQICYVAISLIVAAIFSIQIRVVDYIGAAFYFTNYINIISPATGYNPMPMGHFWSLAVEEHFYLLWPLTIMMVALNRIKMVVVLFSVIVAALIFRIVGIQLLHLTINYPGMASECRIDAIAFGCLFAIHRLSPQKDFSSPQCWVGDAAFVSGAGLVAVATYFPPLLRLVAPGLERQFVSDMHLAFVHVFHGIGLYAIFWSLYIHGGGILVGAAFKILDLRPLRLAGIYSYGTYLWHFAAIYLFVFVVGAETPEALSLTEKTVCALFALPAGFIAGAASFKFALGPFQRLRAQYGSHALAERIRA